MTAPATTCPYCNAHLPAGQAPERGNRVTCPRCGETFGFAAPTCDGTPANGVAAAGPDLGAFQTRRLGPRTSNRALALSVLGLMAVLGGVALWFALKTQPDRRGHDAAPSRGSALGYLPADVNVVAAIQVRAARQRPAGRSLLEWLSLGGPADAPGSWQKQVGLQPENLETVVLGIALNREEVPVTLIVETDQPYDAAGVRAALHATGPVEHGPRLLYTIAPERLPFRILWQAASNVLVLGMRPEQMERLPFMPSPGPESLAVPLKRLVETDLQSASQAWVAGYGRNWEQSAALLLLPGVPAEVRTNLASVRSFNVAFDLGQEVALHGTITCADAKAAGQVAKAMGPWQKLAPGSGVRDMSISASGAEVTVAATVDIDAVRRSFEHALAGPRKP
jgi:hypothetical protein